MSNQANKSTSLKILKTLRRAGYQALFAGGCVRDMLLGSRPHDYDIATDATPDQVAEIFRRTVMVGAQFGVAMVMQGDLMCEVATFRNDDSYSDGRRPDSVTFSTPREDALRRDFTINGMFFDPVKNEVIDYVSGQQDLKAGVIRTIGKPELRFQEDHLRIMRAVRFAVRLGFKIEPKTQAGIKKFAPQISKISGERICDELTKMFEKNSAHIALTKLGKLKIAQEILPELFADKKLFTQAVARIERVAKHKNSTLCLASLLLDLSAGCIKKIIRRWGQSNELRRAILFCTANSHLWKTAADLDLCDLKKLIANQDFPMLRIIWKANEFLETQKRTQSIRLSRRINKIDPTKINPKLFITGDQLKSLGLSEGKQLGKILNALTNAQLNEEICSKSQATKLAKKLIAEQNI